jgi:hypothetical protein
VARTAARAGRRERGEIDPAVAALHPDSATR